MFLLSEETVEAGNLQQTSAPSDLAIDLADLFDHQLHNCRLQTSATATSTGRLEVLSWSMHCRVYLKNISQNDMNLGPNVTSHSNSQSASRSTDPAALCVDTNIHPIVRPFVRPAVARHQPYEARLSLAQYLPFRFTQSTTCNTLGPLEYRRAPSINRHSTTTATKARINRSGWRWRDGDVANCDLHWVHSGSPFRIQQQRLPILFYIILNSGLNRAQKNEPIYT